MISYKPFFNFIEKNEITQYQLIHEYDISTSLLDKLRHDKGLRSSTLNDICIKLGCEIEDIMRIVREDTE